MPRTPRLWLLGAAADTAPAIGAASPAAALHEGGGAWTGPLDTRAAVDAGAACPTASVHMAGHLQCDPGALHGKGVRGSAATALVSARRRGSEHTRSGLRASVAIVAAAALCMLVYARLAGNADGGVGGISQASRVGVLGQRRHMMMLDFDDGGDGGDGGFYGGGGDSFGDSGSFSSADDLEDSGGYVGYLAWSDAKVQWVLNHTRQQLLGMERSWNSTFSPAHVQSLERKVWLLRHAFSRHGYLLEDAAHGLETLSMLTKQKIRDVQEAVGRQNPKIARELAHIVNRSQAMVAKDARIDVEQGRRIIGVEQIDLNTSALVRGKVRAAQTLLAQMERHEMNVTLTLQADAAAFGREASRDMQAAPVEKLLHVLPRKFALNRLADEAVEEEDVVRGKVHAEYMKLLEIEREEERLLLRANMSALELQAREMKSDAEFYNEDADEEAAQARFWRQLRARESALAGQDASEVRATETVVERERMVGEDLAQTMDPCARERREVREWETLLKDLNGQLFDIENAYKDEEKALESARELQRHNIAEEYEQQWVAKGRQKIADALRHKLRMMEETGRLLEDKEVRERARLDGRLEELRAEKKLLQRIKDLVSEAKLTEAKGEATALMKTFFFNRDKRGGKGGGSHDMLGGAGQNALGAVATGLMVNNPQEMSRVTRLLVDMVEQVKHDMGLLQQEAAELHDQLLVHKADVDVLRRKAEAEEDMVRNATRLADERTAARPALEQAVNDADAALVKARGTDTRKTFLLRDSIRRVGNSLENSRQALGKCVVFRGKGKRPEVLSQAATKLAWLNVEHAIGLMPAIPDRHVIAKVARYRKAQQQKKKL